MDTKRLIVLGAFLASLIILVIVFIQSGYEDPQTSSFNATVLPEGQNDELKPTKQVTLFFLSEQDGKLHGEERDIYEDALLIEEAKQTIEELIKGSQNGYISPFPEDTQLRELYYTPEKILYVDFSREMETSHLSGSSAEITTVYSIVNSITHNFKSVRKVFILIDGEEKETLRGHVDLTRPLSPRYNLIRR